MQLERSSAASSLDHGIGIRLRGEGSQGKPTGGRLNLQLVDTKERSHQAPIARVGRGGPGRHSLHARLWSIPHWELCERQGPTQGPLRPPRPPEAAAEARPQESARRGPCQQPADADLRGETLRVCPQRPVQGRQGREARGGGGETGVRGEGGEGGGEQRTPPGFQD